MSPDDKVVIRFNNGTPLKGNLKEFSPESQHILFKETGDNSYKNIPWQELKAIFFVRAFEGDSEYREKKRYGIRKSEGRKMFIKFNDGESMIGYLQGDVPWDKGFFLSRPDEKKKGFFLVPADGESNNIRVFVVSSSVMDITAMP